MEGLDLLKCKECPFSKSKKVTPERDKEEKTVIFVGMAPAAQELLKGEFFVGPSGQLLRQVSESLGYSSYQFTNVLLCPIPHEAPDSQVSKALVCCKPRLRRELELYNPKLVIALGNLPIKALTGKDYGVMKVEGRILKDGTYPVLAVPHPAAVLRSPDLYRDFVDDLKVGIRFLSPSWIQVTDDPTYTVIKDETELEELCRKIDRADDVVVDLETTGLGFYPYGRKPDGIRCAVISLDQNHAYIVPGLSSPHYEPHPDFVDSDKLRAALNRPCIFHNGQFDCGFLWQKGYRTTIGYDTFLAHYMLDERSWTHSLKLLSRKYLGAPEWEEELKEYLPNKNASYDLVPDSVLYKYAAYDTVCTYLLQQRFKEELTASIYKDLIIPCTNMFVDLRHDGIRIDADSLFDIDGVLNAELKEREREISKLAGRTINPSSPKEVAELLYDDLGIKPHKRFGRSTRSIALENMGGLEIAQKIIEYREVAKLKSTYVFSLAKFVDLDLKIHPFLKLFASVTGRLGAADPSVLNVVKDKRIKSLYLPPKGKLFMDADQKQMELRWYCIITGDDHLKELLLTGDPHGLISDKIKDVTGKEYIRTLVKSGVFGGIYMRGIESYMVMFLMSKEDAIGLRDTIYQMVPTLKPYHNGTWVELKELGELESYFGRKRRFGLLTKDNFHEAWRQGVNFKIQSAASDTNLWCMLHLYQNGKSLGCRPVFPVHDSILFSIESEECVIPIQTEMERFSTELVGGVMPFTVESKFGTSWGDCVIACHACGKRIEGNLRKVKVKGITHCHKCAKLQGVVDLGN